MKKLFISLALVGAVALSGQNAFAACGCADATQATAKTPFYYYLNPLQYVGIGNNYSNFSLNPFTGFKNCNRAKVKKCDECTKIQTSACPTCRRAFAEPICPSCQNMIIKPKCSSCNNNW